MNNQETLVSLIESDLQRLLPVEQKPTVCIFLKWYFLPKGSTFPHDVWFRISQKCKTRKCLKYTIGIFAYMIERHFAHKYGIYANTNIRVGKGLQVVHGSGVYLNCKEIGYNFTVYQGVTLGSNGSGLDIPTIEDDVTVYAGAIVVGGITLGKGCAVAANSFVNKDVPPFTLVAGNPAKVVRGL